MKLICKIGYFILFIGLFIIKSTNGGNKMFVLSKSLQIFQRFICDEKEIITLTCPAKETTISIELAEFTTTPPSPSECLSMSPFNPEFSYSKFNSSCEFTPSVQYTLLQTTVGFCNSKSSCRLSQKTFPDPCTKSYKFIIISYKCLPRQFKNIYACHDETTELNCDKNFRLVIFSAEWGRTHYSMICPQPNLVADETCVETEAATLIISEICGGKRNCTFKADAGTFQSQCRNETSPYLQLKYICVPRRILNEQYRGELEADESELDEDEDGDESSGRRRQESISVVNEQPSIYAPNHISNGWSYHKSTEKPVREIHQQNLSGKEDSSEERVIWFYVILSAASSVLVFLLLIILVKIGYHWRKVISFGGERERREEMNISGDVGGTTGLTSKPSIVISEISSGEESAKMNFSCFPPLPLNLLDLPHPATQLSTFSQNESNLHSPSSFQCHHHHQHQIQQNNTRVQFNSFAENKDGFSHSPLVHYQIESPTTGELRLGIAKITSCNSCTIQDSPNLYGHG